MSMRSAVKVMLRGVVKAMVMAVVDEVRFVVGR